MAFDLATFKRNRLTYETTAAAQRIQQDCKQIAAFDKKIEQRKKIAVAIFTISIICTVLSFFVIEETPAPLFVSLAGLGIGWIFISLCGSLDIPDLRHQLLPPLLEVLGRDMGDDAIYKLKLNCTPSRHKTKKVDTIPDPSRAKWKIDRFRDNWLNLSGEFVDGTHFTLSLTELAISKYGWKRSRSGKSKFKRKHKSKGLELVLNLGFSRKRYGAIQLLQEEIQSAIQLPDRVRLKGVKLNDHMMMLTIKAPPEYLKLEFLPNLITQLLLNAFHVLTLAKQLSKPTGKTA